MICSNCGKESGDQSLCYSCVREASVQAQSDAMLNSQRLMGWVYKNTQNPAEGILSLLVTAIRIHKATNGPGAFEFETWVERGKEIVEVMEEITTTMKEAAAGKAPS